MFEQYLKDQQEPYHKLLARNRSVMEYTSKNPVDRIIDALNKLRVFEKSTDPAGSSSQAPPKSSQAPPESSQAPIPTPANIPRDTSFAKERFDIINALSDLTIPAEVRVRLEKRLAELE
jgi:hypothetical protein